MKFGIALASAVDSWKHVRRAEELGFTSSWFYDTQLLNPDVFICMALAAEKTSRIRLGTGVLIPSNRIEPVAANALATLNRIAPGRIDFGVGTGFTARRTMGLKAIPLRKMKKYVGRVQELLSGQVIEWDFESKNRKLGFLNPDLGLINIDDPIALHISAMGPKSRELVAEMGAGWLNFGSELESLVRDVEDLKSHWQSRQEPRAKMKNTLFFLGAVLGEDQGKNAEKLMLQAAPWTAVMLHNLAESDPKIYSKLPPKHRSVLEEYLNVYKDYRPADAKYLENHRGHLMYLREEEKKIIDPDFVRATTMSGSKQELRDKFLRLAESGYEDFVVQLIPGEEAAIEEWADVFSTL